MTVMAERLNFLRFISHFRAVHRGASFAGLRTTSVRKLLPEYALALLPGFVFFACSFSFLTPLYEFSGYGYMYGADHGGLCVLFTHLMVSHVGC